MCESMIFTAAVGLMAFAVAPSVQAQSTQPASIKFLKESSSDSSRFLPVAASDTSNITEEQRVLAVEDEWISAEINRDEAILQRVIDDRFVHNSNSGKLSDKATLINKVLGWNMVEQTVTERTVLVEGDVAVVFGTTELRFASAGKEDNISLLRYTATYIRRQGQWRALALQMAKRESK